MHILFEGTDYVGKTELADLLVLELNADYLTILEPKKAELNKKNIIDRLNGYVTENQIISGHLLNGLKEKDVVIDRYGWSTIAIHGILLNKKLDETNYLGNFLKDLAPMNLNFLLTASRESLSRRIAAKDPEYLSDANLDYLMNVQDEFIRLMGKERNTIIIDSSNDDFKTTFETVKKELSKHYPKNY